MVKVVTDSSCDIPVEIARELSINIVPLYIEFGGKTYRDGVDLDPNALHQELLRARQVPKTSVPSPGDFLKVYDDLASETDEIISIHLSSEFSGTYNAARLAKGYLDAKCRVEVMDSNLVSAGLGLTVMASAKAAQEGKNLDQIVDMVQQMTPRIRMFGKVDNFPYLLKGKRFRLARGTIILGKIGGALHTKLLGEVYDGAKTRSPRLVFGAAMALSKIARWARTFAPIKQAGIAYSTVLDEAEMLAGHLEAFLPKEHILISRLGCATLTYAGPGSLLMAIVCDEQP
jgi:DegV family protein with EDD domain